MQSYTKNVNKNRGSRHVGPHITGTEITPSLPFLAMTAIVASAHKGFFNTSDCDNRNQTGTGVMLGIGNLTRDTLASLRA
jgi:hypothetical protein